MLAWFMYIYKVACVNYKFSKKGISRDKITFVRKCVKKFRYMSFFWFFQLCRELILVKKGIVIPCYDPKVTVDVGNDRMYIRPEGVDPKVVWDNMISACSQEVLNKYDNSYLM